MSKANQTPEQKARDHIDAMLEQAGWFVQDKEKIDFSAGFGITVREYQTDIGPADYVLFIDKNPIGVIEAKSANWGQKITTVEEQSAGYATARLKWQNDREPLPFVYESTGVLTRFTDMRDPKPRSREVFSFPRPERIRDWLSQSDSLRARLRGLPDLDPTGLRACQISAIEKLEASFKDDHPRALIQMATGSGKTYASITSIYRLLKHADAKRILFLVDTKNLGEQAEQEFMAYVPNDDNRKLTELYNVQRLKASFVAKDSQVCISTIQRMYSLLKDQEMDEAAEERSDPTAIGVREGVEEIRWLAALKPTTVGVAEYRDAAREYLEIAVLKLTFRSNARPGRLTELVHRAVPYPVLLIAWQGDIPAISLAHKRWSQGEAGKTVIEGDVVST